MSPSYFNAKKLAEQICSYAFFYIDDFMSSSIPVVASMVANPLLV